MTPSRHDDDEMVDARDARIDSKELRRRQQRPAPGTAPGQLDAGPDAAPTRLHVLTWGPDEVEVQDLSVLELGAVLRKRPVTWVDVRGLADSRTLAGLGEVLGIHPLALEDVVNTYQRPKLEEYGDQLFVVVRMTRHDELATEQFALVLGDGFVVTFQEAEGDWFDPVRKRIARAGSRLRERGPDYLAYALLDAAADSYFPLVDRYGDELDGLEERVLSDHRQRLIPELYGLRRDLHTLRRQAWPLREVFGRLSRGDLPLVTETTALFFRDCHDHAGQLIDAVDSARDQASELIEVSMGMAAQRMNEIMKVLTIMASLFIPLSFIAGLYGMNFDPAVSDWNMPELGTAWGYPAVLMLMAAVATGMLLFFRRKGWIGGGDEGPPAA